MKKRYVSKKYTISYLTYHLIFCSRLKKRIFRDQNIKEAVEKEIRSTCRRLKVEILHLEVGENYVYIHVHSTPELESKLLVRHVKKATQTFLREKFEEEFATMPSIWTLNYFASTEETLPREVLRWYIDRQRSRY